MCDTYKNLNDLLELISEDKKVIARNLISELNFMTKTLKDLKKGVKEHGTVEWFVNGKQEMLRESPYLKSYNTTIQRYSLLYKQLIDLLPKEDKKTESDLIKDSFNEFINGD